MDYVENFDELEVYKLARQLSKEIFDISKLSQRRNILAYGPDATGFPLNRRANRRGLPARSRFGTGKHGRSANTNATLLAS